MEAPNQGVVVFPKDVGEFGDGKVAGVVVEGGFDLKGLRFRILAGSADFLRGEPVIQGCFGHIDRGEVTDGFENPFHMGRLDQGTDPGDRLGFPNPGPAD